MVIAAISIIARERGLASALAVLDRAGKAITITLRN
jgi:hypothetical protein